MWLFSQNAGFLSLVQNFNHPDTLLIRARVRNDLEAFIEMLAGLTDERPEIIELEQADYRYRIVADKAAVANAVAAQVNSINYPNFKNAVHGDPDRDRAYMGIWSAMRQLQDERKRTLSENEIHIIAPYWVDSIRTWVFNDQRANLIEEPFVSGAEDFLTYLVRDIPNARDGFRLTFSGGPFPNWQAS